jgi:hypothetical protein
MSHDRHVLNGPSNFMLVAHMNNAFNNPKGFTTSIDWNRVAKQSLSIADELAEVFVALGADKASAQLAAHNFKNNLETLRKEGSGNVSLNGVRDGLSDIHVFAYGAHHFMGIDADRDMYSVIDGVMTRFIKNEADKEATIKFHAERGVTDVYFEGDYPTMIMKSGSDQPDAPKGKFLKSASYTEPVFYEV